MNIGFDLDGTIYNFHQAVYTELCVYYNLQEDYYSFWTEGYKTYKSEKFWDGLIETKHLYNTQPPLLKDVNFIRRLDLLGHKIYYVSNRPKSVEHDSLMWLKRYKFPTPENLIITKDKASVANSIPINLFFEDRENNIEELVKANIPVLVIRQPYNKYYLDLHPELTILNHVYEAQAIVDLFPAPNVEKWFTRLESVE